MYAIFYTTRSGACEHSGNYDAWGLFADFEEARTMADKLTKENTFGGMYHAVNVDVLGQAFRDLLPLPAPVEKIVEVEKLPEVLHLGGTPLGKDVQSANPVGSYSLINGVSYRLHSSDVHGNDTYRREEP